MTKVTIIPAGYRIIVTTWENDADNYKTKIVEGLTKEQVEFLVEVCKLHYSKNSHSDKKGFGNMYDPSETEYKPYIDAMVSLIKNHAAGAEYCKLAVSEDEDELHNAVGELVYDLGLSGGDFFTRVFESAKIEYITAEITLNDITSEFI